MQTDAALTFNSHTSHLYDIGFAMNMPMRCTL